MRVMLATAIYTVCISIADMCLVTTMVAPFLDDEFEDSGKACTGTASSAKCPFRPAGQECSETGDLHITVMP